MNIKIMILVPSKLLNIYDILEKPVVTTAVVQNVITYVPS